MKTLEEEQMFLKWSSCRVCVKRGFSLSVNTSNIYSQCSIRARPYHVRLDKSDELCIPLVFHDLDKIAYKGCTMNTNIESCGVFKMEK